MKKSNEHLQAQIVEFANANIKEFSKDHRAIIENADTLAKIDDLNALPEDLTPELQSIIEKYKDQYIVFLKQKNSREKIQSSEEYKKAAYPTLLNRKIHDLKASLKILELLEKNFPDLLDQLRQHFETMRANSKYSKPAYEDTNNIRESYNEYKNYDPEAETKMKEIENLLRRIEAFNI